MTREDLSRKWVFAVVALGIMIGVWLSPETRSADGVEKEEMGGQVPPVLQPARPSASGN